MTTITILQEHVCECDHREGIHWFTDIKTVIRRKPNINDISRSGGYVAPKIVRSSYRRGACAICSCEEFTNAEHSPTEMVRVSTSASNDGSSGYLSRI